MKDVVSTISLIIMINFIGHCGPFLSIESVTDIAFAILNDIPPDKKDDLYRSFDDERRVNWGKSPKVEEGLKISTLSKTGKILIHKLLRKCMSREGYLLVTSCMFHRRIQQNSELENLESDYRIELFGHPKEDQYWGWQLEGNHLSLNFTFERNKTISYTPFLICANPQLIGFDENKTGLIYLYEEEFLAGEIASSFTERQKKLGFVRKELPVKMYGALHKDTIFTPDKGLSVFSFGNEQIKQLAHLTRSYITYFMTADKMSSANSPFFTESLTFQFRGETTFNGKHYYRIRTNDILIECRNYGNHSHHLWRSKNDFGLEVINK